MRPTYNEKKKARGQNEPGVEGKGCDEKRKREHDEKWVVQQSKQMQWGSARAKERDRETDTVTALRPIAPER